MLGLNVGLEGWGKEQGVLGCGIESWERAGVALTVLSVSEEG